jgi:hypothetical protein
VALSPLVAVQLACLSGAVALASSSIPKLELRARSDFTSFLLLRPLRLLSCFSLPLLSLFSPHLHTFTRPSALCPTLLPSAPSRTSLPSRRTPAVRSRPREPALLDFTSRLPLQPRSLSHLQTNTRTLQPSTAYLHSASSISRRASCIPASIALPP